MFMFHYNVFLDTDSVVDLFTTLTNWDITTILVDILVDIVDTLHSAMAIAMDWTTTTVVTAHSDMEIWVTTITQDTLGTTT